MFGTYLCAYLLVPPAGIEPAWTPTVSTLYKSEPIRGQNICSATYQKTELRREKTGESPQVLCRETVQLHRQVL